MRLSAAAHPCLTLRCVALRVDPMIRCLMFATSVLELKSRAQRLGRKTAKAITSAASSTCLSFNLRAAQELDVSSAFRILADTNG